MLPWGILKKPALYVLIFFCLMTCPVSVHAVSGNIHLSSEVYEILDYLTVKGCLRTYLAGTRPITYCEAYRLLEESRDAINTKREEGSEPERRVLKAFRKLQFHVLHSLRDGTGFVPFRNPETDLVLLEGEPSPIPGIKSSQHALVYNNEGLDPDEGTTVSLTFESEAALRFLNAQVFSRLSTGEADRELIHRGYVKTELFGMELGVGKESLWWGQGRHGGLFLTSNAEPLPMIRLTNTSPTKLPWIFKYLGPSRLDFFLSRLEEDRAVPEPYFCGLRMDFRPFEVFEAGMTMMIMAGGEGRPDVGLGDLFGILFGENELGGDDRSNRIAGFDFRLTLPGFQIYGEFGGEDEAGGFPSKMASLLGFYLPAVSDTVALRVEYADLAYSEEIAGAWYDHGGYTDGYTYEGRILGHHVGGDGRDLFSEVTFDLGETAKGKVGVDLEWRGLRTMAVTEEHVQVMIGVENLFGEGENSWRGKVSAAVDRISNAGHLEGEDETGYYISMAVAMDM